MSLWLHCRDLLRQLGETRTEISRHHLFEQMLEELCCFIWQNDVSPVDVWRILRHVLEVDTGVPNARLSAVFRLTLQLLVSRLDPEGLHFVSNRVHTFFCEHSYSRGTPEVSAALMVFVRRTHLRISTLEPFLRRLFDLELRDPQRLILPLRDVAPFLPEQQLIDGFLQLTRCPNPKHRAASPENLALVSVFARLLRNYRCESYDALVIDHCADIGEKLSAFGTQNVQPRALEAFGCLLLANRGWDERLYSIVRQLRRSRSGERALAPALLARGMHPNGVTRRVIPRAIWHVARSGLGADEPCYGTRYHWYALWRPVLKFTLVDATEIAHSLSQKLSEFVATRPFAVRMPSPIELRLGLLADLSDRRPLAVQLPLLRRRASDLVGRMLWKLSVTRSEKHLRRQLDRYTTTMPYVS